VTAQGQNLVVSLRGQKDCDRLKAYTFQISVIVVRSESSKNLDLPLLGLHQKANGNPDEAVAHHVNDAHLFGQKN
jgi:hypothetical protein